MNQLLKQAGIIAIPLKIREEANLGVLHPNFLVFDTQSGRNKSFSPNIQTGLLEEVDCVQTVFKIVYREILAETETKQEEFIERILLPYENLQIPVSMLPIIFTHSRIKENLAIVNLALSRFSFRGVLSNLVLEVDEEVLDQIIMQENEELNTGNSSNNPTDNPIAD